MATRRDYNTKINLRPGTVVTCHYSRNQYILWDTHFKPPLMAAIEGDPKDRWRDRAIWVDEGNTAFSVDLRDVIIA